MERRFARKVSVLAEEVWRIWILSDLELDPNPNPVNIFTAAVAQQVDRTRDCGAHLHSIHGGGDQFDTESGS